MLNREKFNKVYPFTNENITSYFDLFNFNKKRVLSVLGSGDQYFSSLLFGADSIDLFDLNSTAYYYFVLKFISLKFLSYQEFVEFFVVSKLDNINIYNKIKEKLPDDVRYFFDSFLVFNKKLSNLIFKFSLNSNEDNFSTGRVIPYLDESSYYILQNKLKDKNIPKVHLVSLNYFYKRLSDKFDVMLFSNIFLYLNMDIKDYRMFLDNYKEFLNQNGVIQADYTWIEMNDVFKEFNDNGFYCHEVPSIRNDNTSDYVFTLKK